MRHYRSSIPKLARERVVAYYIESRQKSRSHYFLGRQLVGIRDFHPTGDLESEHPMKDGRLHGMVYRSDTPGQILNVEPYRNGLPHGVARQWSDNGDLLGTYAMKRGTGLDLWWQSAYTSRHRPFLAEARYIKDGQRHGFEWWLDDDQKHVHSECHFQHGKQHGIEREWNADRKLRRGYPRYWIAGVRVTKRQYLRAPKDPTLPRFRVTDNRPHRTFPPDVQASVGPT